MKHSEFIKKAKRNLWNGKKGKTSREEVMICLALVETVKRTEDGGFDRVEDRISEDIQSYIHNLLGNQVTLGAWLTMEKGIDWTKYGGYPALQDYRLRFMDELIRRYEAEGK